MRTRGSTRRSQKSLAAGLQPVGGRRTRHGQVVHHQVCGRRRRRKPSRQRQVRPPDNGAGRVRFGHQPGKELRYGDAPRLDAVRRDVPERGHRAGLGRAGRPGQEPSGYSSPAPESATPRRWKSVSRRRLCAVRFPVTGHVCDSVPHLVLTVFARQLRHTQTAVCSVGPSRLGGVVPTCLVGHLRHVRLAVVESGPGARTSDRVRSAPRRSRPHRLVGANRTAGLVHTGRRDPAGYPGKRWASVKRRSGSVGREARMVRLPSPSVQTASLEIRGPQGSDGG